MIEYSKCKNCGRQIFFSWRGTHHVAPDVKDCSGAEEQSEEDDDPTPQPEGPRTTTTTS